MSKFIMHLINNSFDMVECETQELGRLVDFLRFDCGDMKESFLGWLTNPSQLLRCNFTFLTKEEDGKIAIQYLYEEPEKNQPFVMTEEQFSQVVCEWYDIFYSDFTKIVVDITPETIAFERGYLEDKIHE